MDIYDTYADSPTLPPAIQPPTAPRICTKCRHFIPSQYGMQYGKCARARMESVNLIDGSKTVTYDYCQVQRKPYTSLSIPTCTDAGLNYEAATVEVAA